MADASVSAIPLIPLIHSFITPSLIINESPHLLGQHLDSGEQLLPVVLSLRRLVKRFKRRRFAYLVRIQRELFTLLRERHLLGSEVAARRHGQDVDVADGWGRRDACVQIEGQQFREQTAMRFRMALGEMKAKTDQPVLARAVKAMKDCALEQTLFQIPADFVLDAFATGTGTKIFGPSVPRSRFLKTRQLQRCR